MKAQKYSRESLAELGLSQRKLADFNVGDTIAVSQRIKEGEKERIQIFQGDVIAMHNRGASTTFTVRKMSENSIAVERIFPLHSPIIADIKLVRRGDVRRAKLFYVRDRLGRSARINEKILTKEQKEAAAAAQAETANE
jgi:large subunit ribosomal protein L19